MTTTVTRTEAGTMNGIISSHGMSAEQALRCDSVLKQWQEAANHEFYDVHGYTNTKNDQVHGRIGRMYARLDIGGSGAFMVDVVTGLIYGIKGYGKVDKKKISGNIYDPNFDGAVLVRDRFRYGRFENNPDGSLRGKVIRL